MKNNTIPKANIDSLLDRIQTEGIQKAESKAREIIQAAHLEADLIITKAHQKAKNIETETKQKIEHQEKNLNKRLTQIGRDVVLNVKGEIITLFERLLLYECRSYLKGKTLQTIIIQIITNWQATHDSLNLDIFINEQDRHNLRDKLLIKLQHQAKDGIKIQGHPDISAGFRIGQRDNHLYYDFTDQAIAETLAQYLRPEIAALLSGKVQRNTPE